MVHTNPHIDSTGVLKTSVNPTEIRSVISVLRVVILVLEVAAVPIAPCLYIRVNVISFFTSEFGSIFVHWSDMDD